MSLVLDTGPIVALLNADDPDHRRCAHLVMEIGEDLVVPAAVMGEVDYWCRKLLGWGALQAFVEDVIAGAYWWVELGVEGLARSVEIAGAYQDLGLGYVDAAVIATCEMLDEDKVATLDRRHFSVVRPGHRPSLLILPD